MKVTKRGNVTWLPYSLHDCRINGIKIRKVDEMYAEVGLLFEDGIYSVEEDERIPGKLLFERVDLDFSNIYIMKVHGPNRGKITGKKYGLREFRRKCPEMRLEIIDEVYGYNQTKLMGTLYKKKEWCEFMIELYHFGNMLYFTQF